MAGPRFGRNKGGGLLGMAERAGIARGLFGGSKGWLYVGTGLWTLRTVRRLAERQPEVLLSEELKPGERLVISNGRATIDSVDKLDAPVKAPKGRKAKKAALRDAS